MAIVREEIMTFGSEQPLRSVERDEDMLLAPLPFPQPRPDLPGERPKGERRAARAPRGRVGHVRRASRVVRV
jgi:hypothetical protein